MFEVQETDLQEIQSYPDAEVPAVLQRLLLEPNVEDVRKTYFSHWGREEFVQRVSQIRTTAEFQKQIIAPIVSAILAKTSQGLSISGLDRNPSEQVYLYVSNHRDILCDPVFFTYGLVQEGWESPLVCLGDNLLSVPWITDLLKVNRGITVKRNVAQRELLRWSYVLSDLLWRSVTREKSSVWIAQREGRAKDGNDETHPGVLKMLALSKEQGFLERIAALHIVPVAISYEYDPCDAVKAREIYYTGLPQGYHKKPGEDIASMILGIQGDKGRIHIEIGREIDSALEEAGRSDSRKDQVSCIATELDRQIQCAYRLWPSHFIAYDLMRGEEGQKENYTSDEKQRFMSRLESQLDTIEETPVVREAIRAQMIAMYARPVENAFRWKS